MSARGGPRRSSGQVRSGRPGRRRRDSIADDASPGHASANDPNANDPNSVAPADTQLDDAPGRRRAVITEPVAYDVPTRGPRIRSALLSRWTIAATVLIWVVATAAAATSVVAVGAPSSIHRPAAAVLMVLLTSGLVQRGGGHLRIWLPIVVALALAATITQLAGVLAAAAGTTAVVASVLAVVATTPGKTWLRAVGEYFVALGIAASGTVAVAAWNAPVSYQRFNLVVLAVALALAIIFVWSLGSGLHGLERQGLAITAGVAIVLILVLVYSSFVREHGSQVVTDLFSDTVMWMRQKFIGVPRPVEVFMGFPALLVGVSLRARRREGWWILVFAVIGTGVMSTSLVMPGAYPSYVGLSIVYSAILGLVVGLIARALFVRERKAKRARILEEPERLEPGRFLPLK